MSSVGIYVFHLRPAEVLYVNKFICQDGTLVETAGSVQAGEIVTGIYPKGRNGDNGQDPIGVVRTVGKYGLLFYTTVKKITSSGKVRRLGGVSLVRCGAVGDSPQEIDEARGIVVYNLHNKAVEDLMAELGIVV